MAQKTLAELKALWIKGFKPKASDYSDLFDSVFPSSSLKEKTIDLTSDQIATGSSLPIACDINPGDGKALECISASVRYTANDGALTFTQIDLITDTADIKQMQLVNNISSASDGLMRFINKGGFSQISLVKNKDLLIQFNADSLSGTGVAQIYLLYREITL